MLTPDQISELHRLYWVEKWSLRRIARHLHIGRRTLAKYLTTLASKPVAQRTQPQDRALESGHRRAARKGPRGQRASHRPASQTARLRRRADHHQKLPA